MMVLLGSEDATGGTLPAAILGLSPASYWDLRETSGSNFNDQGSLGNAAAVHGQALASQAGPTNDGYSYPVWGAGDYCGAPDVDAYSVATASGMTIGCLLWVNSLDGSDAVLCKYGTSGSREWRVEIAADGSLTARLDTDIGTTARQRASAAGLITTGAWHFIIVRYTNLTTAPTIRVDGSAITGTVTGSGTGGSNAGTPLAIGGRSGTGSTAQIDGSMAHVFVIPGTLSDADCGVLEAAAHADGWY